MTREPGTRESEQHTVEEWRLRYALDLGYLPDEASLIARNPEIDLHRLQWMIDHGATPKIALEIEMP